MAGRPRTFDRDAALQLALDAFWEQGFAATSISQLTAAMGIAPPSLYAAFGDKQRLFEEATAHYLARFDREVEAVLAEPEIETAVGRLLTETANYHTEPGHPRGCLVFSEPHLGAERARLRQTLSDRLQVAIDAHQLDPGTDAEALAEFLYLVLVGMSARARDGATRAQLLSSVACTMAAWPPVPASR